MNSCEEEEVPMRLHSAVEYLLHSHSDQLRSIILSPDPKLHYPLFVEYFLSPFTYLLFPLSF